MKIKVKATATKIKKTGGKREYLYFQIPKEMQTSHVYVEIKEESILVSLRPIPQGVRRATIQKRGITIGNSKKIVPHGEHWVDATCINDVLEIKISKVEAPVLASSFQERFNLIKDIALIPGLSDEQRASLYTEAFSFTPVECLIARIEAARTFSELDKVYGQTAVEKAVQEWKNRKQRKNFPRFGELKQEITRAIAARVA